MTNSQRFAHEKNPLARKMLAATATIVFLLAAVAPARSAASNEQEPKYEMGTFYVVMLIKPANFSAAQAPKDMIQEHFKHVLKLIADGKATVAGPFLDDTRVAGVFVLNASSAEEAKTIEEADPLVKSGGFKVEVLKWWAAKGIMKPPTQPFKQVTYYFTFLKHGPKWTAEKTPATAQLQSEHMANINAMAKTGKLVLAGPFEDGGDYAGVFMFKVATLDEAKALAESDPAVKAGRLAVETHPWLIGQGSLP
jgi:uncharacterized protein YciI